MYSIKFDNGKIHLTTSDANKGRTLCGKQFMPSTAFPVSEDATCKNCLSATKKE